MITFLKIVGVIALILFFLVLVFIVAACVAFLLTVQENDPRFFNDDDIDF